MKSEGQTFKILVTLKHRSVNVQDAVGRVPEFVLMKNLGLRDLENLEVTLQQEIKERQEGLRD